MNDELLKKVALLQIKEKVMKDSGDVLTDLADMQALRQFSADLIELIDEQHAAGAIPANPMVSLRERLMMVLEVIKAFREWQLEQLGQLVPFTQGNPKVSLEQINAMISALPPLAEEEKQRIEQLIASLDLNYLHVAGDVIQLHPELEAVQETLLPEFSKYCDGSKGCRLERSLEARPLARLQKLVERHQQQTSAATEIESLLQQGNYRTAQAKAKEAKMLSAEGKSQVGFTDIDFAKYAKEIVECEGKVKRYKLEAQGNTAESFLISAEASVENAKGEFRDDLNSSITTLKANIAQTKKTLKTMIIISVSGVIVLLLAIAFSMYSERKKAAELEIEQKARPKQIAADEKAQAEQLAADEKALKGGDFSVGENVAKHALPSSKLRFNVRYNGWVKSVHSDGKLSELYQYSNGEKNGFSFAWHSNGEKKWMGKYANDTWAGPYTEWYYNGNIRIKANYKDGKRHGLTTERLESGKKKNESLYRNGNKDEIAK